MKGRRVQIKDLPSFLSETSFALYNIYNQGHWPSTELGGNIQVSGNSRSFEIRRPRKKDKNKGTLMRMN